MEVALKSKRNQLESVDPSSRLVEQAIAGCSDSFRQLVEQNHQPVRLYLAKYIRCGAQIDDVAQEVFLIAFSQLNGFRRDAKFSTWLIGIARNKALEFLKAETKARKNQKRFFDAEIANRQISRLERQQQESERAQQRLTAMQLCLDQLPDQSRELIDRYYFDQQTATSIASQGNVSTGSVRMRLLRIRQVLQNCIVTRSQDSSANQSATKADHE